MINIAAGIDYFRTTDTTMYQLVTATRTAANPLLIPSEKPPDAYFSTLVKSIVSQQISTRAAATIYQRLQSLSPITPAAMLACPVEQLRECGISQAKVSYIVSLAEMWPDLSPQTFSLLSDQQLIDRLVTCRGVGVWTAEMFLLFAMGRADIFALNDLGLRQGVAKLYTVDQSDREQIRIISERWSPHRSLASLAVWHQLDNGPVPL